MNKRNSKLTSIIGDAFSSLGRTVEVLCSSSTIKPLDTPTAFHRQIEVNLEKCNFCMKCQKVCPTGAIEITSGFGEPEPSPPEFVIKNDRCILCTTCVDKCPEGALALVTSGKRCFEQKQDLICKYSPQVIEDIEESEEEHINFETHEDEDLVEEDFTEPGTELEHEEREED